MLAECALDKAKGRQRFLVQPSPLSHSDGGNKKTPVDRRCAPARGGLGTDLPQLSPPGRERERETCGCACARGEVGRALLLLSR